MGKKKKRSLKEYNLLKIAFMAAAVVCCLVVFMPIYNLGGVGVVLNIMDEYYTPATLMPTTYGVVMLISAVAVCALCVMNVKIGYVIATIVNVVSSVWGLSVFVITANSDPYKLFELVGTPMNHYSITEANPGYGFYVLIIFEFILLALMIVNFISKEDGFIREDD